MKCSFAKLFFLLTIVAGACLVAGAQAGSPQLVVLDTDIGDDVDDVLASAWR